MPGTIEEDANANADVDEPDRGQVAPSELLAHAESEDAFDWGKEKFLHSP